MVSILPRCVVPIQPLLLQDSRQQGYERFLGHKHRWVLAPYRYKDLSHLQSPTRCATRTRRGERWPVM
jgi:hypothetical protein